MMLPDGTRIIVDPTSIAVREETVLILGANFTLFPDSGLMRHDFIGAIRDAGGQLSPVPTPLPDAEILEPRAVAAAGGGWHVLFVTGTRGGRGSIAYDSASIWYAHYDGHRWSGTQRVARVVGATLSRRMASELVLHLGEPAFAFPYDRSAEPQYTPGNQGVVMLSRRGGVWVADTLGTWEAPHSIQLTPYESQLRAILTMSYFAERRPRGPALFVSDYGGAWSEPRLVHDPAPNKVSAMAVSLGGAPARAVTWTVQDFEAEAERLEWGTLDEDGVHFRSTVTTAPDLIGAAMIEIDDQTAAWLVRDMESDRRLRVYVAQDTDARLIKVLEIPVMNFIIPAVPLGGGRVLVITVGPDTTPGANPPFSSYLTEIAVRCVPGGN